MADYPGQAVAEGSVQIHDARSIPVDQEYPESGQKVGAPSFTSKSAFKDGFREVCFACSAFWFSVPLSLATSHTF